MADTFRQPGEQTLNISAQDYFDSLYERTSRGARIYLTARCRQTADISDLFQETYLEVYKAIVRSRGNLRLENEEAFVIHIAGQKLAKYYARQAKTAALPLEREIDDGRWQDMTEWADLAHSEEPEIDERLVTEDLLDKIRRQLKGRPELVRKIFYLHYDLELSLQETADALRLPLSTVKSRLYRTLRELRVLYSGNTPHKQDQKNQEEQ